MSKRFVIKNHDVYVGGQVGTYADDPSKITVQFYSDINDAGFMDSEKVRTVFDILKGHFSDLQVVSAHIEEDNQQTELFNQEVKGDD
ncbi:hypothetical protein LMB21_03710 [Limosilactobacillus reuteri]|uniref:hypothetical protein n=1 Tax=Limosilactobacillus reuteri TaxID=1598 RepID=UPI001E597E77|nr:hypothetical protein [Limosilactobacillus reuteri]MCC4366426.1 hypothetical protein [Limosilactobacillus reuteri]